MSGSWVYNSYIYNVINTNANFVCVANTHYFSHTDFVCVVNTYLFGIINPHYFSNGNSICVAYADCLSNANSIFIAYAYFDGERDGIINAIADPI